MNAANEKYGSSLDRTLGAGKPVDPATRLSELLAQSLEELTRPFEPSRPGQAARTDAGEEAAAAAAHNDEAAAATAPEPTPEESRIDADKALAELEAELFAAAKQVDRDLPADDTGGTGEQPAENAEAPPADQAAATHEGDTAEKSPEAPDVFPPPLAPEEGVSKPDGDAARGIAQVRKLMLVSMAVTVIAVGSVFGFIGYRIFKGEGSTAKTADKLPESSPIPTDVTLSLPRGARILQSAVAADRLVMTLEIDGKVEVRTFDVKTLQPAGRLNFSDTP